MGFSVEQLKGTIGSSAGLARGNMFLVQLPPNISPNVGGSFFDKIGAAVDKLADTVNIALDKLARNTLGIDPNFTRPDDMAVLCKSTSIPGRQLLSIERNNGMYQEKIAYGFADEPVTMTFYVTNDMKMKDYFDAWQRMVVNPDNGTINYHETYARDIHILHLKKGAGVPISAGDLNLPKIPSIIQNRLPSIGPLNLANGTYNVSIFTGNDVTQKVTLVNAWPTTVQAIDLGDEQGIMEVSVTFTYKKWVINKADSKVGNGFLSAAVGSLVNKIF